MREGMSLQTRRELLQHMLPQYRGASTVKKKSKLLDAFTAATGYNRKYAMGLLNHAQVEQSTPQRPRPRRYGPEVQHALFLVWHAANRICAKRLIPFLPTLVEALERHEHLHLTEECRSQLLSMSAATADRLLRSQRTLGLRGLSTTRAGTLLKQQIPIRTFEEWKETRPGFLEADLVAHCGADIEGGYLYTLTLTDIATGWTECLPLLHRSQEAVVAALQRARKLFPFPLLGIDTDNGGEFINGVLVAYCEQEQITFTRGRPYQKRDQCFVEQKNGAIVRQVVGYDRFVGEHAYRQLTELYRALRLYVNCFQPSMKLLSKQRDGKKVRCIYDPAKTPLQRLLLSGVLPVQKQQELTEVAQALDPAVYCTSSSCCNGPFSGVLSVALLLSHPPFPILSTSFRENSVQRESFLKSGMLPLQPQDSRPCTVSRSGENGSWAGGAPTKTPLRESGSRSSPGSRPIPNAAAATFSGSCSAALPDAINHCKSALCSVACGKSESICWKLLRSSGKQK